MFMDTIIEKAMPDLTFQLFMDELQQKVKLKYMKDVQTVEVELTFGDEDFNITTKTQNLTTATCLLLCALGTVGPILDCYKKNKNDWKGFKNCLDVQGHAIGQPSLICAFNCLNQ
jgi:hypothetical protein